MHLHFIFDEPQYNYIFDRVIEEARARRHVVTTSMRWNTRYDADVYIGLQRAATRACPRPLVMIWHGLGLAKYTGFNLDVDLVLLPSETLKEVLEYRTAKAGKSYNAQIVAGVGSSKIDLLLQHKRRKPEIQQRIRAAYGFDDRPIVGLCPTFRHNGNLVHPQRNYRLRQAEEILERDFNVLVMHHSLESDKTEVEELRFRANPGIDRMDHFAAMDCAVTDTSGLSFELAAVDIPVALLDGSDDPDFLLVRMLDTPTRLDLGPATDLDGLARTCAALIADPTYFAAERARWGQMALGPLDGRSAERVVDAILEFVLANQARFARRASEPELLIDYLKTKMSKLRSVSEFKFSKGIATAALDPSKRGVLHGPYQRLGAGRFVLEVDIEVSAPGTFSFQIDADRGHEILAQREFEGQLREAIPFEVPPHLHGRSLEYRIKQPKHGEGHITYRCFRLFVTGLSNNDTAAQLSAIPSE